MRKYETVLVLNPDLGEGTLKEEVSKLEAFLKKTGAPKVATHIWGRKEIAYKVHKQKFGYFVLVEFESEQSDVLEKLTRQLVISDAVIKFQAVRVGLKTKKFKVRLNRGDADEFSSGDSDY